MVVLPRLWKENYRGEDKMSFYMWLFAVKKMGKSYSKAVRHYKRLSDEEKMKLHTEYCRSCD